MFIESKGTSYFPFLITLNLMMFKGGVYLNETATYLHVQNKVPYFGQAHKNVARKTRF